MSTRAAASVATTAITAPGSTSVRCLFELDDRLRAGHATAVELQVGVHWPTSARRSATTPGQRRQERVDLVLGGVAGQRDPDVAVGEHAHRREDVARLEGRGGARRAARDAEPAAVELGHQRLPVDVQAGEGHQVGEPVDRIAHDLDVGDLGGGRPDPVDQRELAGVDLVPLVDHGLEGGRRGEGGRDVLEPGGALVDPVVAGERVGPADALADEQDADAGRAAPLVGGARGGGPALGQRQPAHRGAGVHEEGYVAEGRGDLAHRLERADLVVGGLEGGHGHAGLTAGLHELVEADPAPRDTPDRPRLPAPGRGVEHGGVLDGGVDDRRSVAGPGLRETEQAAVDGVGAGGGEGDLVRAYPEALGDHGAGVVEQQPRRPGGAVEAAGIGVPLVQRGLEGLAGGGVQRLGGGRVEVGRCRSAGAVRAIRHTRNLATPESARHGRPTPSSQVRFR